MKTIKITKLVIALLFPALLNAQWNAVRFDHSNTFDKIFAVSTDTVFVLGMESVNYKNFVLRTNNGGVTWDSIPLNLGAGNSYVYNHFYINGSTGCIGGLENGKQLLLKTINNGNSWTKITPDTSSTQRIESIFFIDTQNGWATDGWSQLYKTTNGGTSWTTISITSPIHDIYFSDANNGFGFGEGWWGSGAIVFKTTDGGLNWSGVFSTSDPNLFVSSFNKGDAINPNIVYTSLYGTDKLYRTINGANTWDTIQTPAQYINDFDFISADTGHIVSADGEIFVTTNGGINWTLEYATTWGAYGPNVLLYSLSFTGNTGYVCGTNGLVKKHTMSNGINEKLSNNTIRIYPNPINSSENLLIEVKEPIENGIVKISNTLGQIVLQKTINDIIGNSTITLSDINLPNGIYYVVLETKENSATQKLIVVE